MKTRVERARARHTDLTSTLARAQAKRDKLKDQFIRADLKVQALAKSVGRSGKRLRKVAKEASINAPQPKPDVLETFNQSPVKPLPGTEPAKPKRGTRRTPDDFKADMTRKKSPPVLDGLA